MPRTSEVRRLEVTAEAKTCTDIASRSGVWQRYSQNSGPQSARDDPHRHYVLTYLALRADAYLYDIRLNCEFRHLAGSAVTQDRLRRDHAIDMSTSAVPRRPLACRRTKLLQAPEN